MKVAVEAQIRELEMWSAHKLPSGQVRYAAPGSEHDDSAVACMAAALLAKEGLGADVSQIFSRMHAWG
jgi:ADP-ribosylglycohydrolase